MRGVFFWTCCSNWAWSQLWGDGVDLEVQIIEDWRCHCHGKLRETKKNSYCNVWCSSIYEDGWMLITTVFICTAYSLTGKALSSTTHRLILHMSKTITLEVKSSGEDPGSSQPMVPVPHQTVTQGWLYSFGCQHPTWAHSCLILCPQIFMNKSTM